MKTFLIILLSVAAFLILSFCIYLFLIKTERRDDMKKLLSKRYAHRGLHNSERAENSLSAFRAAVDAGYGIELDVRLSKDGELVVFHDDTLERVTDREGRVDSFTAKELADLVWKNLNEDNKVSLFVRTVCLECGKTEDIIINKNK